MMSLMKIASIAAATVSSCKTVSMIPVAARTRKHRTAIYHANFALSWCPAKVVANERREHQRQGDSAAGGASLDRAEVWDLLFLL